MPEAPHAFFLGRKVEGGLERSTLQIEELEFRLANDGSRLPADVAQMVPQMVRSWGQGRFHSQSEMAKWFENQLGEVRGSLNSDLRSVKGDIHEMLRRASDDMSERIEECVISKTLPYENRLISAEMMLRNLLSRTHAAEEARDRLDREQGTDGEERMDRAKTSVPTANETKESEVDKAKTDSPAQIEAAREAKGEEGGGGKAGDPLKGWLEKQIRHITDKAKPVAHDEPDSADLMSWMKEHISELVGDLLPSHRETRDTDATAEAIAEVHAKLEHFRDLKDRLESLERSLGARLLALEEARLPGRVGLLEGACLEERLAMLESCGARTPSAGQLMAPNPQGTSQILALRAEMQRLQNRVALLEGLQIPDERWQKTGTGRDPSRAASPYPGASGEASPASASPPNFDLGRKEDFDDNMKREMMNIWCAVCGDQRTLGILSSKLEDATRDFAKMQTRFEAAMPQLMQLLAELLRGGAAAGTGDTGNAEVDVLMAMQKLLYGGESGMPFVSPAVLRETFNAFEAVMRSEMEKLRNELFTAIEDKARAEDLEFLAEQLRLLQGQLQMHLGRFRWFHLFQFSGTL
ncbi:unnamed protein product [Effrenium voratum]|uniref:Uncharacterized protein n=1 Tax=Effrenium voratum TaxID=2562239 RepID=A0AA36I059_9DINO|nr:unnamed protein product [Effrenium voratum]